MALASLLPMVLRSWRQLRLRVPLPEMLFTLWPRELLLRLLLPMLLMQVSAAANDEATKRVAAA